MSMMKEIFRTPIELFCHDCSSGKLSDAGKVALNQQYCKYIKGTCVKPRKSTPKVKVGICTLGSTVNNKHQIRPVVICPQRFKEDTVFEAIRMNYLRSWKNVKWIPEVSIGVGGNVDYVAVELGKHNEILNFQCVEFQTAGTTGTPYSYVLDLKKYGDFDHGHHSYGINWANEFTKTMMQQAYKKGKIVRSWHRKIVFVIQDVALEYLMHSSDCSKVTSSNADYPVDFCTFSLDWKDDSERWSLSFRNIYSTTIEGVSTIMGGAAMEEYPSEDEFKQNILKKAISDGIIDREKDI